MGLDGLTKELRLEMRATIDDAVKREVSQKVDSKFECLQKDIATMNINISKITDRIFGDEEFQMDSVIRQHDIMWNEDHRYMQENKKDLSSVLGNYRGLKWGWATAIALSSINILELVLEYFKRK